MYNENGESRRGLVRTAFTTKDEDPQLQRKLSLLGYGFFRAVAEGENELARRMIRRALMLQEGIDEEEDINR